MTTTSAQNYTVVSHGSAAYDELPDSITVNYWHTNGGSETNPLNSMVLVRGGDSNRYANKNSAGSIYAYTYWRYTSDGNFEVYITDKSAVHNNGYYFKCVETNQTLFTQILSTQYNSVGRFYIHHNAVPPRYEWK